MLDAVGRRLAGIRQHERLLMIMVTTMLVMSGQGIVSPVLPLFARDFGASVAAVGLTLSVFALARLLLNVPSGLVSDRYGRRLLLVAGPAIGAVGMFGSGLASGIGDLLVWRFVAGAGSALYMTGAQIYLIDISEVENRARVIGANHAALLVGVSIGPGIGGLLADAFGLRIPFLVVGAASLLAALYAWLRLPETRPPVHAMGASVDAGSAEPGDSWRDLIRSPDFLAVSGVTAIVFLTRAGGRMTLMALLAAARFDYTPGALGVVFTGMALINLAGIAPAALISDRFGRKLAIVPSGLLIGLALFGMAAADSHVAFLGAALLLAIGTALIGPAPAAFAADIAPANLRGMAMGLYRSAGDVGFLLGPVLLGALADATSIGGGLSANAALAVVSVAIFAFAARETVGSGATAGREHRADRA